MTEILQAINMISDFAKFKKIDAHSHIGKFGSPFDVDFDDAMLKEQMAEYNIEKTILPYWWPRS